MFSLTVALERVPPIIRTALMGAALTVVAAGTLLSIAPATAHTAPAAQAVHGARSSTSLHVISLPVDSMAVPPRIMTTANRVPVPIVPARAAPAVAAAPVKVRSAGPSALHVAPPHARAVVKQPPAKTTSGPAPAAVPHYTVNVRTIVTVSDNAGLAAAQAAINAGGDVGVFYTSAAVMDVSAHTSNDSLALRLAVGNLVTFTGALSGTYRVTGALLIPHVSSSTVLSRLGTSMAMQTCDGAAQMRIVGLVAV